MRTTNDHRQALRLFAAGRDAAFITEALQLPAALVDEALGIAEHNVARAQQLVAAFDTRAVLVAAANGRPAPTLTVPVQTKPAAAAPTSTPALDQAPAAEPIEPGESGESGESGGLEELLASAGASSAARTRALGVKLAQLVDELRARLAAEAAEAQAAARVAQLRKELAEAEAALRQVRSGTSTPASAAPAAVSPADEDVDNRAVRAWAAQAGVPVAPTGRIKTEIVQQWREATGRAA